MSGGVSENLLRFYPEMAAGGFTRHSGNIAFYARVNALLESHFIVVDIGAGRGAQLLESSDAWRNALCILKGKAARVVGLDIDPAVLGNPFLDEAHVVEAGGRWPLADDSADMIVADWVLEHVADPEAFAAEVRRVLKPGGWFCARTPNRWGLTGLGANLIPNAWHVTFLTFLQPRRKEVDVFPTVYRMNTLGRIRRLFPGWRNCSFITNAEPTYVARSILAAAIVKLYWRATPAALHTTMHVFVRKPENAR